MNRTMLGLLAVGWIAAGILPAKEEQATLPPLAEQARQADPKRYQYALDAGAKLEPTKDGKSFYLLWYPEGVKENARPPMIATIHGTNGWAQNEFFLWHKLAKERGMGILAIQWWLAAR